ncbi:glycosyltransferase [Chromobacterium amazonense]|uniref:glycosyltransferase n=1 Tax=Chromobacterium amazonense TaxID=1382803 RepID=UPI003B969876
MLVDPQDATAIATAINELLGDEDRMRQLGESGKRAVLSKYSWAAEAEKLVALYASL